MVGAIDFDREKKKTLLFFKTLCKTPLVKSNIKQTTILLFPLNNLH